MAHPLHRVSVPGRIFDISNYVLLALFSLTILYPFWTMVVDSLTPPEVVRGLGLHIWNDNWSGRAWGYVLSERTVGRAYLNTLHRVVFGTLSTLFVTFSASYALSKRNLPGRTWITFLFVFTMFFNGGIIPTYLMVRNLGLINSRWVLVIVPALQVFYIIITRNFIMTIDQAMEDSAVIDGANYWTIMFRIILPLSKPVMATVALWTAVAHWNFWFDALIYINDRSKRILQLMLRDVIERITTYNEDPSMQRLIREMCDQGHCPDWATIPHESIQAATVLVTIGPIIIFYPFVQKYFVKGAMLGSLKG